MVIDMKCKNCGANLLDTDLFCDQCGWKVVKERRCPECNAPLREGTKFCPKCGMLIGGGSKSGEEKAFVRDAETTDIPIADIEQNILFETEREIHKSEENAKTDKTRRAARTERNVKTDKEGKTAGGSGGRAAQAIEREARKKKAVPAPEPRNKKKPVPAKKRIYEEWEEEEDEDEDDEEDEGFSFITIVSVFMAFLILAAAVFLIYSMRQNRPIKNYGEAQNESTEGEQEEELEGESSGGDEETENGVENGAGDENSQDTEIPETDEVQASGTLFVTTDVNIRDNPSTEGTNVIKVAKTGEVYEYIGMMKDGSWYHIILEDGSTGYVSAKYISTQ